MPKLTAKTAIIECKEIWKEIKASGLSKSDFLRETPAGESWLEKYYHNDCPLCEYFRGYESTCSKCPLVIQYAGEVSRHALRYEGEGSGYDTKLDECICYDLGFAEGEKPSQKWLRYIENLEEPNDNED
jgi:hypothetical protein